MSTGKSSRTMIAALAGLILAETRWWQRRSGVDLRHRKAPRPNRYGQGFNRSQEMERRRRQIERGYLRTENGLVKP
jgi:hypothetical protein